MLTKLHALTPIGTDSDWGPTDPQREALVIAFERDYFNSPRDVTMADPGEELGISQQAIASRLRRGIRYVLAETFCDIESSSRQAL